MWHLTQRPPSLLLKILQVRIVTELRRHILFCFFFFFSFASRAINVKNKPHINEVLSDAALLKRYARQIAKLQTELEVSMMYLILGDV